mgnify:CR=1 FL=1
MRVKADNQRKLRSRLARWRTTGPCLKHRCQRMPGSAGINAYGDDAPHTRVVCPAQYRRQFGSVSVEVRVGINERLAGRRKRHLTRAPLAIGFSGVTRQSKPSVLAASSMPLDSSPRILAGARLATTTMCLPIRSAG